LSHLFCFLKDKTLKNWENQYFFFYFILTNSHLQTELLLHCQLDQWPYYTLLREWRLRAGESTTGRSYQTKFCEAICHTFCWNWTSLFFQSTSFTNSSSQTQTHT